MGNFDAVSGVVQFYKAVADEANALGARIKAAREKPDDAIDQVLSTSTDSKVTAWREADERLAAQIKAAQEHRESERAKAKAYAQSLLPTQDETFDLEAAKKEFAGKRAQANEMHNVLANIVGKDNMQALMEEFGVVEVTSLKGTSSGSRGSTNIRRPRISAATWDGQTVEKDGKTSFTLLSQVSKVPADTLREAAFAAAGTSDLSSLDAGTVVNFTVSVKGATHTVSVTTLGKGGGETDETPAGEDETPADETTETE